MNDLNECVRQYIKEGYIETMLFLRSVKIL